MRIGYFLTLTIATVLAGSPVIAQEPANPAPQPASEVPVQQPANVSPATGPAKVLWRGLAAGMTPQEAIPAVSAIEGVKRVKLTNERRPAETKRLSISYHSGHIPIGGLSFEIQPMFSEGRLEKVALYSQNLCSSEALTTYASLSEALRERYPEVLVGVEPLTERDVAEANLKALQSGEKSPVMFGFGSEAVAAVLSFHFAAEQSPPYPGSGSRLMTAIWRLAETQYSQRQAECGGTGDRRMDVAVQYMQREAFDGEVRKVFNQLKQDKKMLLDQL